jgi:DNA-directed RNA polymerase alpha subunit
VKEPSNEQRMAVMRAANTIAREASKGDMFRGRGLSNRTVDALVNFGIDAPEHLLFMTEEEIKKIPGVGKSSLAEIRDYRAQFMRQWFPT